MIVYDDPADADGPQQRIYRGTVWAIGQIGQSDIVRTAESSERRGPAKIEIELLDFNAGGWDIGIHSGDFWEAQNRASSGEGPPYGNPEPLDHFPGISSVGPPVSD